MLRKSIHFSPAYWQVLQGYMKARGIASPSLAVETLIRQLLQGGASEWPKQQPRPTLIAHSRS